MKQYSSHVSDPGQSRRTSPLGALVALLSFWVLVLPSHLTAQREVRVGDLTIEPEPILEQTCLWANDLGNSSQPISLWDINNLIGTASNPRPLSVRTLIGIEWDAAAGKLWGVNRYSAGPYPNHLYSIHPTSGVYTAIGDTSLSILEGDISVDPTTGTLYYAAINKLYTLDKATGAATLVGTMNLNVGEGQPDTDGIAFDASGRLYVLDGRTVTGPPTLYEVNPLNASVLSSIVTSASTGTVAGYDIDPASGTHYVLDGASDGTKDLRTLNPANGQFVNVGPSGLPNGATGLTTCVFAADSCIRPPGGLQGWWPFDHSSGNSAPDIFNGNNGTVYGASWTTGVVGNALDFDGVNDYVQVSFPWTLDAGTGDFSIDLWIKTTDTGHVTTIVDKRSSSAGQYYGYLFFLYKGYLALQLADGGWTNYVAGTAGGTNFAGFVADGEWHLAAVTVDRDDPQGIRWYIDGVEVGTRRNPSSRQGNLDNSAPVYIGRQANGSYLDATMEEIEFFSRELSATEIQTLWAAGSHGKCKDIKL